MSNFNLKTLLKGKKAPFFMDGRPYLRAGESKLEKHPIGGSFTTAGLPSAAGLVDGLLAYDSDRKGLVVTSGGVWVLPVVKHNN
jgi:hypothetical protein